VGDITTNNFSPLGNEIVLGKFCIFS